MALLSLSAACAGSSNEGATLSTAGPTVSTSTSLQGNFYNATYPLLNKLIGIAHEEVAKPLIFGQGQAAVIAACRRGLELLAKARVSPQPVSRTGRIYLVQAFEHYQRGFEQHCIQNFSSLPLQEELGSAAGFTVNVMDNEMRREREGR